MMMKWSQLFKRWWNVELDIQSIEVFMGLKACVCFKSYSCMFWSMVDISVRKGGGTLSSLGTAPIVWNRGSSPNDFPYLPFTYWSNELYGIPYFLLACEVVISLFQTLSRASRRSLLDHGLGGPPVGDEKRPMYMYMVDNKWKYVKSVVNEEI